MGKNDVKQNPLKPLEIRCISADCNNGLHCFKATRKMRVANETGHCRYCGIQLVDWERVHKRDNNDVEYTFNMLKHEFFRHYIWHIDISQGIIDYALRKGLQALIEMCERRMRTSVGPAKPFRDGYQTPRETSPNVDIIHLAQHATAACCRTCIEYWHGIPKGRELNSGEIKYLTDLAMLYIKDRLPSLSGEAPTMR